MKKRFTAFSADISDPKPNHKKTILDDIKAHPEINSNFSSEENLKRQTFLLSNEIVETIKDFVYTQKMNGNLMYTQKDLIEESLKEYLKQKKILKRPPEYTEKRGRKN